MTDNLGKTARPGSRSLNRSIKDGLVWIAVERGGLQVLNLLTGAVLARLLVPAMFGLMGMSSFFTGLSRRLSDVGFGAAIIRRPEMRPDHLSTLFVLTLALNTTICLGLIAVSPFAGRYFNEPLVGEILRWMSLVFILRCIGVCPTVILRRRLDFKSKAYASFVDGIVKIAVSVPLAWYGYGVWSLVYAELASSLADKLYLAWAARWVPSFTVTRRAVNDLFAFGMNMSLRSILVYVSENVDNFIVGKSLGMSALGIYEKSYNLMRLPVSELSGRLNIVLFPALARMQDDHGRFRAAYRKSILAMSLLGYPLFATLAVVGGPLILLLYGSQWGGAVVPFQILCITGPLRMTSQLTTSAIDACGRLGQDVRRRAAMLVFLIPAVLFGLRWGLPGVASAVLLTALLSFLLLALVAKNVTPVKPADLLRPQLVPAIASVLLAGVGTLLVWLGTARGWPAIVTLLVAAPMGLLTYGLAILLFRTPPIVALWLEVRDDARRPLRRIPLVRRWA